MSEYQYYEFQAIDRRLTEAEMQTLRRYSSRAQITPTNFVNEYNWGDFKGDVDAWMERYFDAFLYFANWGTRILKLRLPARLLDLESARTYLDGARSSVRRKGDYVVLTFESECDGGEDTYDLEAAGLLSSMISLRTELAHGDRCALYLAWLASIAHGDIDDDAIEPPLPAGLGELTGPLSALADFIRVDPDLLEVAARASASRDTVPLQRDEVQSWVAGLAPAEKDETLTRLVVAPDYVASVSAELQHRFGQAHAASRPAPSRLHESRRTVGELLRAMEERAARREQETVRKAAEMRAQQERESAAARVRYLNRLAGQQARLWAEAERLAATKIPKSYDLAVVHLVDLRDLADRKGGDGRTDFATRLEHFRAAHARKPSLLNRLNRGGLFGTAESSACRSPKSSESV